MKRSEFARALKAEASDYIKNTMQLTKVISKPNAVNQKQKNQDQILYVSDSDTYNIQSDVNGGPIKKKI